MFSFFKRKKKIDDTPEVATIVETSQVNDDGDTAHVDTHSLPSPDASIQTEPESPVGTNSNTSSDPITTPHDQTTAQVHTESEVKDNVENQKNQPNEKSKKSWLGGLFGKKLTDTPGFDLADQTSQTDQHQLLDVSDLDTNEFEEPFVLEDTALDDLSEEDLIEQALQAPQATDAQDNRDEDAANSQTDQVLLSDAEREKQAKKGWFSSLKKGLNKTGDSISFAFKRVTIDEALMDELEESLIMSDGGIEAACIVVENLRQEIKKVKPDTIEQIRELLAQCIANELRPLEKSIDIEAFKPNVMMMVGVNGVGKTTTIGKLAKHLLSADYSVLLAAGDTFRAAAREQLTAWGDRNQITVISQEGADPAAVIFDAVQSAKAKNIDVVMADTAGRLPTQAHLMEELKKIKRVITKADATAPHEVLLVIDANNGQNALNQVIAFHEAVGLTGLIVTKLDGTAKGGIVLAIARQCPIPIYFIGVGEKVEDLMPFDALSYGRAMVGLEQD